jgi:rhodanese-related sulfurtransferase
MKKGNLRWVMVLILTMSACFLAERVQAENFPKITAEQVKAKLDAGEKLLLINPLSDIEFQDKHIPGSINIPLQNILVADLPKDKDRLIITYCLGGT